MTARAETELQDMRAHGPRLAYESLPERVRDWVEASLGGPVVTARTQTGGFSPGVAARVRTDAGATGFVKAVGTALNPDTPDFLRAEITVLDALPNSPLRPGLLATYDDGDWVVLLLEEIDGHCPTLPWRSDDLRRVQTALEQLAATHTPNPWTDAQPVRDRLAAMFANWEYLAREAPDAIPEWAARRVDALIDLSALATAAVAGGDTLVHLDVRSDNILITDERVVFVDWNWCGTGPAWVDTVCLALEVRTAGGDADALLEASPLTRRVESVIVTGMIAGLTGMFERRGREPAPPGLPRLRTFQAAYADALGAWTRERMGWS
jgi:hypothetical protein